jgi:hypothetical protein
MKSLISNAIAVVMFASFSPPAVAQQAVSDTTVSTALQRVRVAQNHNAVLRLLRQQGGVTRSRVALDELADDLVAIVSEYREGDPHEDYMTSFAALLALGFSKRGDRPYPGAFGRLRMVVEGNAHPGLRGVALRLMVDGPIQGPVLRFLAEVAVTSEGTALDGNLAAVAVDLLAEGMGPPGLAALRGLYRRGAVVEQLARERLEILAEVYGWS